MDTFTAHNREEFKEEGEIEDDYIIMLDKMCSGPYLFPVYSYADVAIS